MASESHALYQAVLTLAIAQKQAIERDDIDELADMMQKREQLLAEIEAKAEPQRRRLLQETLHRDPAIAEIIRRILETDKQVEHAILARMAAVRKDLSDLRTGQRLLNGYRPAPRRSTGSLNIGG
ncbi:MAG: flagellar protein FliT [Chloroflexi bacterium]|nr:flagellar protein FliT [Chloroflexota bacterium]